MAVLLITTTQCNFQPTPDRQSTKEGGEKLRVVASTNIIADMVKNVGGGLLDLTIILPVGSDPHSFIPTPADMVAVADAQIIFINGLGLEQSLAGIFENSGQNTVVVTVADGIETRRMGENIDPHIWLNVTNAIVMTDNIEQALTITDPANADIYQTNSAAYKAELAVLDKWVQAQIATIPPEKRKMVTDHDSFGYYADRYGLELIGAIIPAYSANAEPSAGELAALQDSISRYKTGAIFVGTTVNAALAERLADDNGIKLILLYTGSLGVTGSGADSYINLIRYNTTAIVEALK